MKHVPNNQPVNHNPTSIQVIGYPLGPGEGPRISLALETDVETQQQIGRPSVEC